MSEKVLKQFRNIEKYYSFVKDIDQSLKERELKLKTCIDHYSDNTEIIQKNQHLQEDFDNIIKELSKIDLDHYNAYLLKQLTYSIERKNEYSKKVYQSLVELEGFQEYEDKTDAEMFPIVDLVPNISREDYKKLKNELTKADSLCDTIKIELEDIFKVNLEKIRANQYIDQLDTVLRKIEDINDEISNTHKKISEIDSQNQAIKPQKFEIIQNIIDRLNITKSLPNIAVGDKVRVQTLQSMFESMINEEMDKTKFALQINAMKSLILSPEGTKSGNSSPKISKQTAEPPVEESSHQQGLTASQFLQKVQKIKASLEKHNIN